MVCRGTACHVKGRSASWRRWRTSWGSRRGKPPLTGNTPSKPSLASAPASPVPLIMINRRRPARLTPKKVENSTGRAHSNGPWVISDCGRRQRGRPCSTSPHPWCLVGNAPDGRCRRLTGGTEDAASTRRRSRLECGIVEVGCLGLCYAEPLVVLSATSGQPGHLLRGTSPQDAAEDSSKSTSSAANPLPAYACGHPRRGAIAGIPRSTIRRCCKPQVKGYCGTWRDHRPGNIDHYLAAAGTPALERALATSPEQEDEGPGSLRDVGHHLA